MTGRPTSRRAPRGARTRSGRRILRRLFASALTDVGRKRDHNEDAWDMDEALGVYVVCDGMGGHASGEVASRLTAEHAIDFVREHHGQPDPDLPYPVSPAASREEALLSNAVQHANDRVYIESMKDPGLEGMGTTVVAIHALEEAMIVAHVGDSRVYRWSAADGLEQVTRDHSLLNHKIDTGELRTPEEIDAFTQGNIIVRAIGLKDYVEPEVQTVPRRAGDLFLLCSDGLTDLVDDALIAQVLEAHVDALEEAGRVLVRMANDRGGKDNITVMFVRVDDRASGEEITDPTGVAVAHDADTYPSGLPTVRDTEPAVPDASGAGDDEPGFDTAQEETDPGLRHDPIDRSAPTPPPDTLEAVDPLPADFEAAGAPVDPAAWEAEARRRGRAGTPMLGYESPSAGPPDRSVRVHSGTTSTGRRRARPTPPPDEEGPSVIVEEPKVIVDDGE